MSVPHTDPSTGAPHPDPERLVLAALPAEPDDPAVVAHLRTCARCRAEVADLRRVVDLAREGGQSDGVGDPLPPPPLRVWQAISAELGLPGARNGQVGGPVGARPAPAGETSGPRHRRTDDGDDPGDHDTVDPGGRTTRAGRRSRRVLVPLVAAVLGLGAGLGIGHALPARAPAQTGVVVRLTPVGSLDPSASGTVAMASAGGERQMVVQVRGVTDIAGGDHLEAWLMDASGTRLVPLGALDGGGGDFHGTFALPAGLPLDEFTRVDVSAERWDGNPGHSTQSVLRGDIS